MKMPPVLLLSVLLFLLNGNNTLTYSQYLPDGLKARLAKPDLYKLMKAESFISKGRGILAKDKNVSDSIALWDTTEIDKNEERIDEYYANRIKASYCFKNANGLIYTILDKNIRSFWKTSKNDKKTMKTIIRLENEAYDSLVRADKMREHAEQELYIEDKMPLVDKAETIENLALSKLGKVLYVYLNWVDKPDLASLFPGDSSLLAVADTNKTRHIAGVALNTATSQKDTVRNRATSLYGIMRISADQVDRFNEFLKAKHPDKAQSLLIDYQKLYDTVIDSLHKEWHQYQYASTAPKNTAKPEPLASQTVKPPPVAPPVEPTRNSASSLYSLMQVPFDQVDQFNEFLKMEYPSKVESLLTNFQQLSDVEADSLRNAWSHYQTAGNTTKDTSKLASHALQPTIASALPVKDTIALQATNPVEGTLAVQKEITAAETPSTAISEETSLPSFFYKVQISASREPLKEKELRSKYSGSDNVITSMEDNWYKYTLGIFQTYREARMYKEKIQVKGAFVVAYFNGKRIKITFEMANPAK